MVLFAQVAAKGKQAAFDRDNFDCFGGLCSGFGKQCYKFPLGGVGALGKDMFTFAVPYRRFEEMEENVKTSFLKKKTWRSLMER